MIERLSDDYVTRIAKSGSFTSLERLFAREVQERRAVEAKLRELHHSVRTHRHTSCNHCILLWPCPTIRLLDGES